MFDIVEYWKSNWKEKAFDMRFRLLYPKDRPEKPTLEQENALLRDQIKALDALLQKQGAKLIREQRLEDDVAEVKEMAQMLTTKHDFKYAHKCAEMRIEQLQKELDNMRKCYLSARESYDKLEREWLKHLYGK